MTKRDNIDIILVQSTINEILQEDINLAEDQHVTLGHKLFAVREPHISKDFITDWEDKIRNCIERYDRDEPHSRTACDVFKDLNDRLS